MVRLLCLKYFIDIYRVMKMFLKCLAGLSTIALLAGVILAFIGWSQLPDMAASNFSKTLKVKVEIGDIGFGLETLTIEKFTIDNPQGFSLAKALGIDSISINAPILGYLHDDISITEITLDNVYVGLEFDSPRSSKGNWTTLLKNGKKSRDTSVKKSVLIKKLVLNNIQAELLYQSDGKVRRLPVIPQIVLYNISSEGGNLSDQLMNTALGEMIKEVFIQENLKDALDQIFQNPQDLFQQFKGFFK